MLVTQLLLHLRHRQALLRLLLRVLNQVRQPHQPLQREVAAPALPRGLQTNRILLVRRSFTGKFQGELLLIYFAYQMYQISGHLWTANWWSQANPPNSRRPLSAPFMYLTLSIVINGDWTDNGPCISANIHPSALVIASGTLDRDVIKHGAQTESPEASPVSACTRLHVLFWS